jgi:hypothetical protein
VSYSSSTENIGDIKEEKKFIMTPLNFIDWFVKLLSSNISSTFFV